MSDTTKQPNVVLICVDQWRGDCLSIDGHPVVSTPYLDSLALSGTRFSRTYTATPTCIPARAALFTGLSQRTHGRVSYKDGVPWDYQTTLAGEFTRGGYQTQAIGKMHVFPERSQLGFQNVILHDGFLHYARSKNRDLASIDDYLPWLREQTGDPHADYFDNGLNCNSCVVRPWDKEERLHPTNWAVTQGIQFLRRRDPRKPFFLYLSLHRPHPPLDPPQWAFDQYIDAPMPDPPVGDWADMFEPFYQSQQADLNVGKMNPVLLRRARAGYYGHMSHIDGQINRFLESLREFDAADTYVCFVSDHGDLMGDHHLFRKSVPYEGSARVPLILSGPQSSKIAKGAVRDEVAELRDVMPTLLDCAGLPIPESVEGRSLLPAARGEDVSWRDCIHGEHGVFAGGAAHYVTDGKEKYIWWSRDGREQLFDLRNDPQELHDLANEASPRVERWRRALIEELKGREEGFTDGETLIAGRPTRAVLSHLQA